MQIQNTEGFMKSSGDFQKSEFTIKNSAKAFGILSSALYQNKIRAIVRELSCNAIDAQRDAGRPEDFPFNVKLPNRIDPSFLIRDFGTGISPENIEKIYTTYFESTKTNSNEMIGCLGLGSKTPFCYTDNFMIRSFYNGVCYSYNASLNEEGLPVISFVMNQKTEEDNGLEVSFAVRTTDFSTFQDEANFVFFFLPHKPSVNVTLANLPDMKKASFAKEGEFYFTKDFSNSGQWNVSSLEREVAKSYVLMGNVPYALSTNIPGLSSRELQLAQSGIHIIVPIGAVEPQASREALSYTKATNAYLKKRLEEITAHLVKNLEESIKDLPNYWQACEWARTSSQDSKSIPFMRYLVDAAKYDGKSLSEEHRFQHILLEKGSYWSKTFNRNMPKAKESEPTWFHTHRSYDDNLKTLFVAEKSVFDFKTGKDSAIGALKRWMLSSANTYSAIRIASQEMIDHFGFRDGIEVFNMESLPAFAEETKKVRVPRASGYEGKKKSEVWFQQSAGLSGSWHSGSWVKKSVVFDSQTEERIYIEKDATSSFKSDHQTTTQQRVANFLSKSAGEELKLYALTPTQVKEILGNPTWVPLKEALQSRIRKFLASSKEKIQEVTIRETVRIKFHELMTGGYGLRQSFVFALLEEKPDHEFSKFVKFYFSSYLDTRGQKEDKSVLEAFELLDRSQYWAMFSELSEEIKAASEEMLSTKSRIEEVFQSNNNIVRDNFDFEFAFKEAKSQSVLIQLMFETGFHSGMAWDKEKVSQLISHF